MSSLVYHSSLRFSWLRELSHLADTTLLTPSLPPPSPSKSNGTSFRSTISKLGCDDPFLLTIRIVSVSRCPSHSQIVATLHILEVDLDRRVIVHRG